MALNPNIQLSQTVAHEPRQETSDDRRIKVETNGGENLREDESRPPKSEWIISINKNLDRAEQDHRPRSWAKCSIYQIPHHFKGGKEKACVPQIVSLGPYHHSDERLREKDKDKWRSLMCMLKRKNRKIEDYLDAVKQVEERARACYEGTIKMRSEEFVMMMVLNGCFVIELLWRYSMGFNKLGYTPDDPVFSSSRSWTHIILQDMILLKNQIPLFILDLLRRLEFDPLPLESELHCLELFRRSLLYLGLKPAAAQYFGKMDQNIQFKDGTLEIPRLMIQDATRSHFLNLIAFEQCHFNCSNDVTSYMFFMDNLINSVEDVGHLHDCEIMEHWLESDTKVADLFNQLCKEVVLVDSHNYLSRLNHWSIISLIAAFILLGLILA
ncbi:hypothetical protein EUGRSUZ_H03934 [Eucalyptus grandis]|uniref:Uncharacterized protein n=2 Tax=Eucalyptus grandis TaxID=71139 RepID=A0ACC3JV61_EUCGR|nr:hypothetical protein EUGRSUZ_H03934 [Eucalyptus grandis]